MEYQHELIICIVNDGFSQKVMETAKKYGARGGTIAFARGTASKANEQIFGISITPEKELLMILVPKNLKAKLMQAIYEEDGLHTAGQGIVFSLPVDEVMGLQTEH